MGCCDPDTPKEATPEQGCCGPQPPLIRLTPKKDLRIKKTSAELTWRDRADHVLARLGYRRDHHRVEPGLYSVGEPGRESPVFVTANYTLSFDALRCALRGIDGHILVLDTLAVNVWCAAGKGSFGTDELVRRIQSVGLERMVDHRRLTLPQLGAPGVAAHDVASRTGFTVEYGPVRAADIPAYLAAGEATPEMRRVEFGLLDRAVLVPVEMVNVLVPTLLAALALYFLVGPLAALGALTAVLAGAVGFPLLLPWLPLHDFSSKGFLLGTLVALPFAVSAVLGPLSTQGTLEALAYLLGLPPVTAFIALNFTGSSTFTSKSGVSREMANYIPAMAWSFGAGVVSASAFALMRVLP